MNIPPQNMYLFIETLETQRFSCCWNLVFVACFLYLGGIFKALSCLTLTRRISLRTPVTILSIAKCMITHYVEAVVNDIFSSVQFNCIMNKITVSGNLDQGMYLRDRLN